MSDKSEPFIFLLYCIHDYRMVDSQGGNNKRKTDFSFLFNDA